MVVPALLAAIAGEGTASGGKGLQFGVMTHFAQGWSPVLAEVAAKSGAAFARDELYWKSVEAEPRVFRFPERYERYMHALAEAEVEPLIVLSFENANYDGGQTPHSEAGYAAFARYALEVLRHYGKQIRAVEVWNEYNGSFCRGPAREDRPLHYANLLKAVYAAVKAERPDVTVVGGATIGIPMPYLRRLAELGAMEHMDVLSVHTYAFSSPPEGMERAVRRVRQWLNLQHGGAEIPIWITEAGWYTRKAKVPGEIEIDEEEQARFLVRGFALLASAGAERICWYLLRDYSSFRGMGLVRGPDDPAGAYAEKASFRAFRTLAGMLGGGRFVRREGSHRTYTSLLFETDTGPVRVMWAPNGAEVRAEVANHASTYSPEGRLLQTIDSGPRRLFLRLSDAPVYVRGDIVSFEAVEPKPLEGELWADSEEGFSATQGHAGWSYGWRQGLGGDFLPATQYKETLFNGEWIGGGPYASVTRSNMHPSARGGAPVFAVRRWKTPEGGRFQVTGVLDRMTNGDGVEAIIRRNDEVMWRKHLGGGRTARAELDITMPLEAGDSVSIEIGPGPVNDKNFDATRVWIQLYRCADTGTEGKSVRE